MYAVSEAYLIDVAFFHRICLFAVNQRQYSHRRETTVQYSVLFRRQNSHSTLFSCHQYHMCTIEKLILAAIIELEVCLNVQDILSGCQDTTESLSWTNAPI